MRILSLILLAGFFSGCATLGGNLVMSLAISSIEAGIGSLEGAVATKTTKISNDKLAQLKPGMTKDEVNGVLQKPPLMVTTEGDGGSMATYSYNADQNRTPERMLGIFGIMGAFTKGEKESQTIMIRFDPNGRYVTHTLEETRVCGSQATGYFADNCEFKKTAGVN